MSDSLIVFLQKSTQLEILHQNYSYITLTHPRSGPSVFLLEDGNIFEFQKANIRKLGCIFTDNKIASTSNVYMATPFDPRFLVLPHLMSSAGKYRPMDQILPYVEGCDQIPLNNIEKWNLNEICDINDKLGPDMLLYKYNDEKTSQWLKKKVLQIADTIAKKRKARVLNEQKTCVDTFRVGAQGEAACDKQASQKLPSATPEDCIIGTFSSWNILYLRFKYQWFFVQSMILVI